MTCDSKDPCTGLVYAFETDFFSKPVNILVELDIRHVITSEKNLRIA
jgi:hypothetical protein